MRTRHSLLCVVNELSDASSNRLILSLVKGLDRNFYDVRVGFLRGSEGSLAEELRLAGARLVNLGSRRLLNGGRVAEVLEYIRHEEVELVHTHVLRSDIVGGAAARLAGVPVLSTKHNAGYQRGQKGWIPRIVLERAAVYLPRCVVTVSESMRQTLLSRFRFEPRRVVTIHNGVDAERFAGSASRNATRSQLGLEPSNLVVTYTGRFVRGKGLSTLIGAAPRVFERNPAARYLLVGDGPLVSRLESQAKRLGVDSRVHFVGFREEIPEILSATDVLVLPSLSEGLPMSLLEGMAAGVAIVATPVGGVPELVESGVTGLMVPPGDRSALEKALCDLIEDPALRERLGRGARGHVRRHYTLRGMVSAYDSLYREHLDGRLEALPDEAARDPLKGAR